jgi:hypothetical protein
MYLNILGCTMIYSFYQAAIMLCGAVLRCTHTICENMVKTSSQKSIFTNLEGPGSVHIREEQISIKLVGTGAS